MMVFFVAFWMTVLFIKWIARTSFRSFVLGTVRIRHTGETWKITWFQTTTEEMWFRGIFARFAYGDNIKKGFCAGTFFLVLVSSGLFMAMHLANPEVLSSKGSAVGSNSIFVDYTSANKGMWGFIATLVANIPVLIYVIIKSRKKTKNRH